MGNRWRKADGILCRNDNDCNWVDEDLKCDYKYVQKNVTILNETQKKIDPDWFGGQAMSVVGECHCSSDDNNCFGYQNICAGAANFIFGLVPPVLGIFVNLNL